MKRIIRVFPRKTSATPDDEMVRVGCGPGMFDECDEVHISVAFEWDLPEAERLSKEWKCVAPVHVGGPATGERGESFIPGMYIKTGYVITSRGCTNQCWFCSVWKREGGEIRELPITPGWNVLDDNLLACSDDHIRSVFSMLEKQAIRPQFTGGLEAKRLLPWHAEELKRLRAKQVFFAYDTPDDYEPLLHAGGLMKRAGFTVASHTLRCYVLCGYPGDDIGEANKRMLQVVDAGFTPMAMLWRDRNGLRPEAWGAFQRMWARPAIIHSLTRK